MRVILTGATGFVGRYVARELELNGIEFVSLQRVKTLDGRSIQMDLHCPNEIEALFQKLKPTHLIHVAWYVENGKCWDSDVNLQWVTATKRLVEAFCASGGRHIVVTGSCAEYDWSHGYCLEDVTPLNPATLYGICKDTTRRITELLVDKYGVSMTWARIFFPYGQGESSQRLIPSLFKAFKDEILPFGVNANFFRDFIHVEDVARAVLLCAQNNFVGAINICSGRPVQIEQIVDVVANITCSNPELILKLTPKTQEIYKLLVGNNNKLISLGWKQEIDLAQGLMDYQWRKI